MQLEQILSPASCRCDIPGANKKRILKTASELVAANLGELATDNIFDALMAREQLGSTGLGSGIAIPHCRVAQCQDILGALITLETAIDFDSLDGKPVDILFVLIVPELQHDEHIKTLAGLAELFNDEGFCEALRHTHDSEKLYKLVINY
ncbi:MAG: PTS sugar transporter subunit IIA [Pseudohongiellaceae bacterium]